MSMVLEIWLRSSLLLLVAFGIAVLLRRGPAHVRHAVLACALALTIPVGVGTWLGPRWTIALPVAVAAQTADSPGPLARWAIAGAARPDTSSHAVATSASLDVRALWLVGLAVLIGHLLLRLERLRRLIGAGIPVPSGPWATTVARLQPSPGRPVRLVSVAHDDLLATCGASRPYILVPRHALAWPEPRIEAVVRHELAHVERQDWAVSLGAQAIRALYWFNPLVWLACHQLRVEAERACDEAVVRGGLSVREYAVHLIDIARACGRPSARALVVPMSRKSVLERRITSMLSSLPTWPSRRTIVAIAASLACAAVALSSVGLTARAPQGVSGTVYDPSGGVVPGARVTLAGSTSQQLDAETGSDGRFEIPAVAPGKYTLSIAIPGFKRFEAAVDLERDATWSRNITLQLGEVEEEIRVTSARITTPRSVPGSPEPVRVGGNVEAPRKVRDVKPIYPESMRAEGVEGIVPIEAIIDATGSVKSVRILTAAVHPELALAAADAVRQWRFSPTRLNGTPVEVVMNVSIAFELEH